MVQEEHKILGQEIMAPVSQYVNDSIELLIVRGVPESNVIQLFAEELDGVAILAQDTSDANARGIASDFKHLAEVG